MGDVSFETLEAICDALPFDLTFIDENDTVSYYNRNEDKVFKRTPEHIGGTVQECHKEENRPRVNEIMDELRKGRKSLVKLEERNGRKIWQGYLRVSARDGSYIGALELTQDVTEIHRMLRDLESGPGERQSSC
jgi:PAS domain S-box-containing protein